MSPYALHELIFHLVPVTFALFGAWLVWKKGQKSLLAWGVGTTLGLAVLVAAVPSVYVLYDNGPRAAASLNGPGLPLSILLETAILVLAEKRVPLPRWAIVLVCILIGQWPVMVGNAIA